jgi:hypothetical protein
MSWVRKLFSFEEEFGSDELVSPPDTSLPREFDMRRVQAGPEASASINDAVAKVLLCLFYRLEAPHPCERKCKRKHNEGLNDNVALYPEEPASRDTTHGCFKIVTS